MYLEDVDYGRSVYLNGATHRDTVTPAQGVLRRRRGAVGAGVRDFQCVPQNSSSAVARSSLRPTRVSQQLPAPEQSTLTW